MSKLTASVAGDDFSQFITSFPRDRTLRVVIDSVLSIEGKRWIMNGTQSGPNNDLQV